ncbi:MAG: PHB depolymerase family esterase [Pseudomonadota bacterium]
MSLQTPSTHRLRPGVAAVCLVASTLGGCECEQRSLEHGGLSRTYLLHLPDPRPEVPPPLVLALHGRLGTAAGQRRTTGYNALADRDGVVVAYPDGVDRSWADARDVSPAHQQGVDDESFLLALIDAIDEEIAIDRDRIGMMGISNGGFMTQTMACKHGALLAGAAAVVATIPENLRDACAPAVPLSVLFMNGTEDPLVPFEGGTVDSDVGGEVLSFDDAVATWVVHDRCDASPTTTHVDEVDDDTAIRHDHYPGCASGTAVEAYAVEGGGHTWPGGGQYLPEGTVGRVSTELEGTELIWNFLLAQRRAASFE